MTLASYEICKRLKELNYHGTSRFILVENPEKEHEYIEYWRWQLWYYPKEHHPIALAPYLEEIAEWLREEYDLNIVVAYKHQDEVLNLPWTYDIQRIGTDVGIYDYAFESYKKALENAIDVALRLVKSEYK